MILSTMLRQIFVHFATFLSTFWLETASLIDKHKISLIDKMRTGTLDRCLDATECQDPEPFVFRFARISIKLGHNWTFHNGYLKRISYSRWSWSALSSLDDCLNCFKLIQYLYGRRFVDIIL